MEIKVIKDGWEIIKSGYLIISDGEYVDFNIDGLLFRLSFETVEDAEARVGYGIRTEQDGHSYMLIKCENFNKSLLRTINEPIQLAKKDGRNIALQLTTSSLIHKPSDGEHAEVPERKILFYCWMIELPKSEK